MPRGDTRLQAWLEWTVWNLEPHSPVTHISDILIIGGGIAGTSVAAFLAAAGKTVTVLEREDQPGYHSTGRSAALYSETYGPPLICKLSTASRSFLEHPPQDFCDHPLLTPRGVLMSAGPGQRALLDRFLEQGRTNGAEIIELSVADICNTIPIMRPGALIGGALEIDAMDIDVHALHWGFIRMLKRHGGTLVTSTEATSLARDANGWTLETGDGRSFGAKVVVNAAGAWADQVARLAGVEPIGLVPKRRTAATVEVPVGIRVDEWPMLVSIVEDFYFKPDAGRLLVSPADATPTEPQDAQPEDIDIAIALDRLMTETTLEVRRPHSTWAGLRSFVADGDPVSGFDATEAGFYWLAGQGGYGIATAPAMGKLAASQILGEGVPTDMANLGITASQLAPDRPGLRNTGVPNR